MTTSDPTLSLHVFGSSKGESIVLELPGGKWGVIDCYAPSLEDEASNPTLRFLKDRHVDELEFLALTHPHDDHFRGMSQLLQAFPVRLFWRFSGLSGKHLEDLVTPLRLKAAATSWPDALEDATEFGRIFGLVQWKREHQIPPLRQRLTAPDAPLYPVPHVPGSPLQVVSLAPSGN